MITLTRTRILDQQSAMIDGCHGEVEGFYRAVEEELNRLHPPQTTWRRESVAPSKMKGITGKRRDALAVTNTQFREHVICIMARDYGATLDIDCYHAGSTRGMILSLLGRIPYVAGILNLIGLLKNLDVLDEQDLDAWHSVTAKAVEYAAQRIKEKRNLEATIAWKSKGLIGA